MQNWYLFTYVLVCQWRGLLSAAEGGCVYAANKPAGREASGWRVVVGKAKPLLLLAATESILMCTRVVLTTSMTEPTEQTTVRTFGSG